MSHEFWYLSRAAGFTAYALLAVSVLGGLMLATRPKFRSVPLPVLAEMHKAVSLLAVTMTLLHAVLLLGDTYVTFSARDILVPFASPYRPFAVGLGVLALYGLVVLVVSFYIRPRIGYRAWRAIHYVSFAVFGGATVHGILAGTDVRETWFQMSLLVAVIGALLLLLNQAARGEHAAGLARAGRLATGGIAAAIVVGFVGYSALGGAQPRQPDALASSVEGPRLAQAEPVAFYEDDDDDHDDDDRQGGRAHDDDDDDDGDDHRGRHGHDDDDDRRGHDDEQEDRDDH